MLSTTEKYLLHYCKNLEREKNIEIQPLDSNAITHFCNQYYNKLIDDVVNEELRQK